MKRQTTDIYKKYKIRWCAILVKRMKENGLRKEEWVDEQVVISIKQRFFFKQNFWEKINVFIFFILYVYKF